MNALPHIPVCNKGVEVTHWLKNMFVFCVNFTFFFGGGGGGGIREFKSLCFAAEAVSIEAVNT